VSRGLFVGSGADPASGLIAALEQHRQQMDSRIQCLTRNRDAISRYLEATRHRRSTQGRDAGLET
jgi:hypothetical protein